MGASQFSRSRVFKKSVVDNKFVGNYFSLDPPTLPSYNRDNYEEIN
jgi:hypothetical protein